MHGIYVFKGGLMSAQIYLFFQNRVRTRIVFLRYLTISFFLPAGRETVCFAIYNTARAGRVEKGLSPGASHREASCKQTCFNFFLFLDNQEKEGEERCTVRIPESALKRDTVSCVSSSHLGEKQISPA